VHLATATESFVVRIFGVRWQAKRDTAMVLGRPHLGESAVAASLPAHSIGWQ
jgi:hypothetical protein